MTEPTTETIVAVLWPLNSDDLRRIAEVLRQRSSEFAYKVTACCEAILAGRKEHEDVANDPRA